MALKALEIRAFQPMEKPYRKTDDRGLYLEVRPNGSKIWYYKYRAGPKEKRISLGTYPDVTLAEARDRRDEHRKLVSSGGDPALERKKGKIATRLVNGTTFQAIGEDFIQVRLVASGKAEATIEKARWYLSHLARDLGDRPIAEIEPAEVLFALKKIERAGKRETAVRTRALASRVFRHGVALTCCKSDPAALLSGALANPIRKHHAAILDPAMLGELLRAIEAFGGSEVVKYAMKILPHVFLRPGELRQGRWSEIDWEEGIWKVPAERTKLRRQHSVPLSRQVLGYLRELREITGRLDFMFPGVRSHRRPMSDPAINSAFRRMGFDADTVTAHGLRSTASTLLNESGKWHPDAIERALAHGHSNAVRGAYARSQHWDERVAMGQWWSDYLDLLKTGEVVLPNRVQV